MSQPSAATASWRLRRRTPPKPSLIDRLSGPADGLLQVLMQDSALGLAAIDRNGRLVCANEALRRMLDRGCDASPGRLAEELVCPERRAELRHEVEVALLGRHSRQPLVSTLRGTAAGAPHTVELAVLPLREPDGGISGVLLQVSDITLQTRLQAQLAQGQKLQAVGQLAGGIAHDFNNLLTAIIGAADEALARRLPDPETGEDLQQIRTSAGRGASLVRQLLAFGRQQTLQPQAVPINEAVAAMSGLFRRLLGSTIQLEQDLADPGPVVCVDPTQLDQVLLNLAVNARDAMPQGGTLTLRTGHITLFRALIRGEETILPGRYVMVEVQDTGVGIPPEVLPRIFEPFFTTKREQGGTGLGLSTVHGIIRQSDGFLAIDSLPGQGTRVRLYLPRHDGEVAAPPKPPPPRPPPAAASGRVVLLVDDEDPVRRLAARALERRGWTVLSAECGEAALALLSEHGAASLCAIVSDVIMPGLDGPALVRAVRALRPGLPAILASGYAEEAIRSDLAGERISFLAKPYTLAALAEAVAQVALPSVPDSARLSESQTKLAVVESAA